MKIETPVLRRLGPVPFWRGERKCLDALEAIYRKVREAAEQKLDPSHQGEGMCYDTRHDPATGATIA